MRGCLHSIGAFLALASAVSLFADDQQKAQKQVSKLTAMATDATGRRIVSMSMSDLLRVKRPQLVQERRDMGLNYGSLFIIHELAAGGANMADVATQLKAGKNAFQAAGQQHVDWKRIATDAKKLNSKIDENLYKHFLDPKADRERDEADRYNVVYDGVKSDNDVTSQEIAEAQQRYISCRDRATQIGGRLDSATEQAARSGHDHIRTGGSLQTGAATGPH